MAKLASATQPNVPFQLTTDGLATYPAPVERNLGDRVDYAQHIKIYGQTPEGVRRYSPAKVIGAEKKEIHGDPETHRICTSHIETPERLAPAVVQAAYAVDLRILK